jgi:hypothetical protein
MIQRIESTPINMKPVSATGQDQTAALQQQRDQVLTALRSHPASGRLVINISSDIGKWENTPADIEMRAGDTLLIPKRPNFVMVSGQVYNSTAISYVPSRDAGWYLRQAGGPTPYGNKKLIYVLRADGAVVIPREAQSIWMGRNSMGLQMQPGDTILVPEKIMGGSQVWQNILSTAMIMSTVASPLAFAGVL